MADASGTLIANLKASLANSAKGWIVQAAFVDTQVRVSNVAGTVNAVTSTLAQGAASVAATPLSNSFGAVNSNVTIPALSIPALSGTVSGGDGSVASTIETKVTTSVALYGANVKQNADDPRGLQILYQSVWINGAFSEGFLNVAQAKLRTTDTALDTTIRALATSYFSATDAAIAAIL